MALRVLTAARTSALISLAVVKQRLQITDSSSDSVLADLIAEACSAMTEEACTDFARQEYEGLFVVPCGRAFFYLPRFPIDPESVVVTYEGEELENVTVGDPEYGLLERKGGWPADEITITWWAGYLPALPSPTAGAVAPWAASTAFPVRSWTRSSDAGAVLRYEATTGGTTAATEPTWPTVAGQTVVDGSVTWTARTAPEVPEWLRGFAWLTVQHFYGRLDRPQGLSEISADGFTERYSVTGTFDGLPSAVRDGLRKRGFLQ